MQMKVNTSVHLTPEAHVNNSGNPMEVKKKTSQLEPLEQENAILKTEIEGLKAQNQLLEERLKSYEEKDNPLQALNEFAVVLQGLLPFTSDSDNQEYNSLLGVIESEVVEQLFAAGNQGSEYANNFMEEAWEAEEDQTVIEILPITDDVEINES
jgi:hypothetical protein